MQMRADTTVQYLTSLINSQTDRNEDTETVIEVFDTALPIDSLTGTSPLKYRTTEHRRTKLQEQTLATEQLGTQSGSVETTERQHEEQTVTDAAIVGETQIEIDRRYGMTWLQRTLCYIGIGSIVLTLLLVAWRLLKRHLTII